MLSLNRMIFSFFLFLFPSHVHLFITAVDKLFLSRRSHTQDSQGWVERERERENIDIEMERERERDDTEIEMEIDR